MSYIENRAFFKHFLRFGWKAVQVVAGALRLDGGLEEGAMIVLPNLAPRGDVGRMVLFDFRHDFEIVAPNSATSSSRA